jgi:hypothetical protein
MMLVFRVSGQASGSPPGLWFTAGTPGRQSMKPMDGWGVTGWANSWTALGSDVSDEDDEQAVALVGYGVQRTVDPGVTYAPPPEMPGVPRWHPKRQAHGRIFEMVWQEDREPTTRSLLDIHAAIAARRTKLTAEDPDLAALDKGVELLLATAESLHAADASIGFLQPNSCRVGEWRDGGSFVVLPDVGFAWDKRAGLMMPSWIAEPALGQLFEHGAERRNEEYHAEISRSGDDRDIRKRASDAAARELADVKILARLVAASLVGAGEMRRWCGDRKCLLKLPPKDVAPDTQAEIWDKVIASALAGQIATVKELRLAFAAYKPSSHFLHEPPAPPWTGWAMLRRGAMVTAALAMIGLLWAFSGTILEWLQGRPSPFCRTVTEENPLHARLFQLEKARDVARGDVSARPAYWALLRECRSDHAALKACRSDCLAELVAEWVRQTDEEGQAVRERLRARPRPTPEEVQDIATAIIAIRQAEAEGKRPQRSAVVSILERELRLRGGKVPAESSGP